MNAHANLPALSPQALRANAALLRHIGEHPGRYDTAQALAQALGKDRENLKKSLKLLRDAGMLERESPATLTDAGRAVLAELPPPAAPSAPANAVRMADDMAGFAMVDHQLIVPDLLNPRKDFTPDEEVDFIADIRDNGLLSTLLIRPAAPMEGYGQPMHRLVAGERRWRAIAELIRRGEWRADRLVPCQIRDMDDEGHAKLALIENLQRKDLKPLEEARGFQRLIDDFGYATAEIATAIGFSQRMVQQRLQLLDLDEDDQEALDAGDLSIEQARRTLAAPKPETITLSDDELFAMAEIAHKWEAAPRAKNSYYSETECRHGVKDKVLKRLVELNFVSLTTDTYGNQRTFVRRAYHWPDKVELPEIPKGTAIYRSTWLNAPFPIPPEGLKRLEARRAETAATKARNKATREVAAALAKEVGALVQKPLPLWPDDAAEFGKLMARAGSGWPWAINDKGEVKAEGSSYGRVGINLYQVDPSLCRLLAFAVNAAGADQTQGRAQSVSCNHILGISINELNIMRALFDYALGDGDMTLEELVEKAGVSIEEAETFRAKMIDPFTSPAAAKSRDVLARQIAEVAASGDD